MTDPVPGGTRETAENAVAVDRIVSSIGPRLRELRLQHNLSLQQLAVRAGVSAAAIHKIERNGMVPTITTLLKLAEAFDRPVSYFVDEEVEGAVVYGSPPGVQAETISGSYARFFLDGTVTTVAPGAGSGAGLLQHQGEELVFMLSGDLEFSVDGTAYRLRKGDTLHFRTDRPHRWVNAGTAPAEAVWVRLRPL
jgi:transcriptional regulator with XRE-family HTH domain